LGVPNNVLHAVGHIWGEDVTDILDPVYSLEGEEAPIFSSKTIESPSLGFDIVFMADLVFNRSEHEKLLRTLSRTLSADGTCYVTYSHHDPRKREEDLNFFVLAAQEGERNRPAFEVNRIKTWQMVDIFLENDGLDEER